MWDRDNDDNTSYENYTDVLESLADDHLKEMRTEKALANFLRNQDSVLLDELYEDDTAFEDLGKQQVYDLTFATLAKHLKERTNG